ncbi:type II toxin-antitoxin system HigB family toxin [Hymenobacter elongatus]|uniref:Type II toxin-antitoxin system HigB family toxin n=1 Tax=Hymenobacter elongatus TaxID=877208 RepID=A0A4Z0PFN2_9BACT|nr:type II toxin-antitoxin system HigB family toxin [Hymenobacter elongatus]TGE13925.1 type II toxin-antitoxin system HigB family toxin [Hymenobacter elongatus]
MRIIAKAPLREFWEQYPAAALPLQVWYKDTSQAVWHTPNDVKAQHGNASIVGNNRVVFNIKGNDFRLVVAINYAAGIVFIRFIGTHAHYDKINAATL